MGRVALVVTEAATNLVKHTTQGGELLVRSLEVGRIGGIEILALDKGPGIGSVGEALRDGFSTSGSSGTGLGAIRRLSTLFDIHSLPGVGTAILARLWSQALPKMLPRRELEIGVVNLPKPGEEVCGDAWAVEQCPGRSLILVVDGLGHGTGAAQAAIEAVKTFRARPQAAAAEQIEFIHTVRYCGVGNISGVIWNAERSQHMVSHNGTAGYEARKIQEFDYPWRAPASYKPSLLIFHSDGLATRWDLARYPGLAQRHPSLVAGVLYRDFRRGNDDATVLVARARPVQSASSRES